MYVGNACAKHSSSNLRNERKNEMSIATTDMRINYNDNLLSRRLMTKGTSNHCTTWMKVLSKAIEVKCDHFESDTGYQ